MRITQAPVVTGGDLVLRQIESGDIDAWYAYLSIPRAVEHTSWDLRASADLLPLVASYTSEQPDSAIRFAILDATEQALVGTIGYHTVSGKNHTAEIAFDLKPACWGRGIMPRCVRSVVSWGFTVLGLVRIQAMVLDTNAASIRVLDKCGFTREGRLRSYRMVRAEPRDFWMYSVVRLSAGSEGAQR